MSDANLGRALLEIGTDNKKFDRGLKDAEGKATGFLSRLKSLSSRMEGAFIRPQVITPLNTAFKNLSVTVGASGKVTQRFSFENSQAAEQATKLRQRTIQLKEAQLANVQAAVRAKEATTALKIIKLQAAQAADKSTKSFSDEKREMINLSGVANSLKVSVKGLTDRFSQGATGVISFGRGLSGLASGAAQQAIGAVRNLAGQVGQAGSALTGFARQVASSAVQALSSLGSRALSAGKELISLASTGLEKAGQGLINVSKAALSAAGELVKLAGSGVNRLVGLFGKLSSGALKAARDLAGFGADAAGKAVSGLSRLGQEATTVTVKIEKLAGSGRSLLGKLVDDLGRVGLAAGGLKALAGGAEKLTSSLTGGNAEFEQYQLRIQTLIRNSDDFKRATAGITDQKNLDARATRLAADEMQRLASFNLKTPFDLKQTVQASTILRGFGLAAEDAKKRFGKNAQDILTISGDVASGTGADFTEITDLIGKFSAGATGEALARFQELGIVTRNQLRKAGLMFTQSGELVGKSQAQLDRATTILLQQMSAKYGGLMDKQSMTFSGMLSNLRDWVSATGRTLAAPVFTPIEAGLKRLLDYLGSDAAAARINQLRDLIQRMVDRAVALLPAAEKAARQFETRLVSLHKVVTAQVIPALKQLYDRVEPLAVKVLAFANSLNPLKLALVTIQGYLAGGINGGLSALGGQLGQIVGTVRRVIPSLVNVLTELGQRVIGFVNEYGPRLFRQLEDWGRAFVEWVAPKAKQLLDELGKLAIALFGWIKDNAPTILDKLKDWGEAFVKWATPVAGKAITELGKLAGAVLRWIAQQAPSILDTLARWGEAFVKWAVPIAGSLLVELVKLGEVILRWVVSHAPAIARQLGDWIRSFVEWVREVGPGVISRLREMGQTILDWIIQYGPGIIQRLLTWRAAFLGWIAPIIKQIAPQLASLAGSVLDWITNQAPTFLDKLLSWGEAFGDWIIPLVGPLLGKLGNLISVVLEWIGTNAASILDKLLSWGEALLGWIMPVLPRLAGALGLVASTIINWLAANAPRIASGALAVGLAILSGLLPHLPAIVAGLADLFTNMVNWLRTNLPTIAAAAYLVAMTLAESLIPKIPQIVTALTGLLNTLITQIRTYGPPLMSEALKVGQSIAASLIPKLPDLVANLTGLVNDLTRWLKDNAPTILDTAKNLAFALADALVPKLPDMIKGFFELLGSIVQWLTNHTDEILNEGLKIAGAIGDGLKQGAPDFAKKVGELLGAILRWLSDHGPEILSSFLKFAGDLVGSVVPAFLKGFGVDATGALNGFGGIINDLILPVLKSLLATAIKVGQGVADFAKLVIAEFGGWKGINALIQTMISWFNQLWPVVVKVAESILSILVPIFRSMVDVINTTIMPAVLKFADFFETEMMPVLRKVGDFIANTLVPVFGKIAAFIMTDVLPVVLKLVGIFIDALLPVFEKVTKFIGDVILPKLHDLFEFVKTNVIPVIGQWASQISDILGKAFEALGPLIGIMVDQFVNAFKIGWQVASPIIGFFLTSIQKMIEFWTNLKDTVVNVWNNISSLGSTIGDVFKNAFRGVMNFIIGVVNSIVRVLNGAIDIANSLPGGFINISHLQELSYFAKGTNNAPGGPAIVGEKGPELLKIGSQSFLANRPTFLPNLPAGSSVLNAAQTRKVLAQNVSGVKASSLRSEVAAQAPINIVVNPSPGMDERQLAKFVAEEVAKAQKTQERKLTARQGYVTRSNP